MKLFYRSAIILCAVFMALNVFGQTDTRKILEATDAIELSRLSQEASDEFYRKKAEAKVFAEANNLPMFIKSDGYFAELMYIDDAGLPVYFETGNVVAAQTTNTNDLHTGGSLGLNLEGAGFEIGEWDGGAVLGTHEQMNGRVTQLDVPAGFSTHATHVAGTLIGDGTGSGANAASAKGMAPQATLQAWDFNNPIAELLSGAAQPLLVSNHSYGPAAGWTYNPADATWYWFGGTAQLTVNGEDPRFGIYDYDAHNFDVVANLRPYHLICFAAMNKS